MRDDICTIPISEIFEVNDGCPICRMRDTVEKHLLEYILGDAMMEPDVRILTNQKGFCTRHYEKLLSQRGRLQLALILQTHLDEINKRVFSEKTPQKQSLKSASEITESCFLCEKIEWGMSRLVSTVYRCYENEEDFRALFNSQPAFCLPHYEMLMHGADKRLMRKHGKEFEDNLLRIAKGHLEMLYGKISQYCSMYDYRSSGSKADMEKCKNAVEHSIYFLNAEMGENNE